MTCQYKKNAAKRWRKKNWLIVASLLLPALAAAQERINEGVRSAGMGGAYMGIADDVNGISFNPSGLVFSPENWLFEFGAENLFSPGLLRPFGNDLRNDGSLTFSTLGGVYNHLEKPNRTTPVLAMTGKKTSAWARNNENQSVPTSNAFSVGGTINYLNAGFLTEWAARVFVSKGFFPQNDTIPTANHRRHWLALSVTGKLWRYQYDGDIADRAQVNSEVEREAIRDFFNDHASNKNDFGLDFGATLNPSPCVRAGVGLINLIQPDLGIASASRFYRSVRSGVAVLVKPKWEWLLAADVEVNLDVEVNEQVKPDTLKYFFGSEINVLKAFNLKSEIFKLRAGFNCNWISTGFKLGVPFDKEGTSLDVNYAVLFFRHAGGGLYNHRLSLSLSLPFQTNKKTD
jgi:hypothetical protein